MTRIVAGVPKQKRTHYGARLHHRANSRPRLPDGIRIYALTDIHGCAELLRQMFAVIDADLARTRSARAIHVFLGDYIDRGPDSRGTIDLLLQRADQHECVFLKGNHEYLMLQMLNDPARFHEWKQFGGLQTLISYGVRPILNPTVAEQSVMVDQLLNALPDRHRAFLRVLKSSYSCGDFFFVHAGVKPGVPLSEQRDEDMLWIRDEFLECEQDFGKYIVHGHTPARQPDIRHNRINIDTGAYATGNLTLLSIRGGSLIAV